MFYLRRFSLKSFKKSIGKKCQEPYSAYFSKILGPRTALGREAREALKIFNILICKTEICQRITLCESGILGQTIYEYAANSQAYKEFEKLGKEVLKWQKQDLGQ